MMPVMASFLPLYLLSAASSLSSYCLMMSAARTATTFSAGFGVGVGVGLGLAFSVFGDVDGVTGDVVGDVEVLSEALLVLSELDPPPPEMLPMMMRSTMTAAAIHRFFFHQGRSGLPGCAAGAAGGRGPPG